MSRSAGITWRAMAGAAALLLLSACSANHDDAMAEKVAAAQAAADKAIAAQKAAEKAALAASTVRPAPAAEPTVMADTSDEANQNQDDNEDGPSDGDHEVSMGGEGATVSSDGVMVPGRGV